MPGGLANIMIQVTDINALQYNAIFSAYGWPDVIMPILGGVIVDRGIGIKLGFLLFTVIAIVGQGIFAAGGYLGIFWVMVLGRIVYGCGMGTLSSLVTTTQVLLFKTNSVLSIAICASFLRLGAGLALLLSHRIYRCFGFLLTPNHQLGVTLGVGLVLMIGVLVCDILLIMLDVKVKRLVIKPRLNKAMTSLWNFPLSYWYLVLISSLFFAVIFSLVGNGQLFFISKYGLDISEASLLNSLNYVATVFVSPFLGVSIRYFKRNSVWIMFGGVFGIISHILFMGSSDNVPSAYIAAVLVSLSYTFVISSIWPLIGETVKPHQLTTAYGIAISASSFFYTILSVAEGKLIDDFGFLFYEVTNLQFLWITVLIIPLLWIEEIKHRNNAVYVKMSIQRETTVY